LADGSGAFIRNHAHLHADYLAAFRRGGLDVLDCVEPVVREEDARAEPLHRLAPDAVTDAMAGLPYVLVWELAPFIPADARHQWNTSPRI